MKEQVVKYLNIMLASYKKYGELAFPKNHSACIVSAWPNTGSSQAPIWWSKMAGNWTRQWLFGEEGQMGTGDILFTPDKNIAATTEVSSYPCSTLADEIICWNSDVYLSYKGHNSLSSNMSTMIKDP